MLALFLRRIEIKMTGLYDLRLIKKLYNFPI